MVVPLVGFENRKKKEPGLLFCMLGEKMSGLMVLLWYSKVIRQPTGDYHDEMSAIHFEEWSVIV